ncbi:hypothetical protein ACS0TY_003146 [Phlomoides rotata]
MAFVVTGIMSTLLIYGVLQVHSDKSFDLDNPKDLQWVYSKVQKISWKSHYMCGTSKFLTVLRLVIRTVGSLEGTAKDLNPDFKEVESAYSFVIGRLLMDPSPGMRKILGQLLIRNDGTTRWNQLEKLVGVFFSIDDLFSRRSNRLIHSLSQAIMAVHIYIFR